VVDEEYVQEHILTGGNVAPIGGASPARFMASQHRRKQHTIIGNP
jgi:hypothetical protein